MSITFNTPPIYISGVQTIDLETAHCPDIIRKASEARPKNLPLSDQAKADWDWFISRNGKEFNTLEYPSLQENAELIISALLQK